ncbi:cytochrome P450 2J6-like [Diadema antillarum]|uniref:cytochrome P450 2J6-like n=1 Tax=Diadema antillarum TaxID=105358 RepID=UPI003A8A92C9
MDVGKVLAHGQPSLARSAGIVSVLRFLLHLTSRARHARRNTVVLVAASIVLAAFASYQRLAKSRYGRRRRRLPPGPTNYPFLGILPLLGSENPGKSALELSKKYGPVFYGKLGSFHAIFLNDYESVKEAFARSGDAFSDRPRLTSLEIYGQGRGVACCHYDNQWKEQRRFLLKLLRNQGMGRAGNSLENRILTEASILADAVAATSGENFDPKLLMTKAVSNIICSLTFGKRFDYDDCKFEQFINALERVFEHADVAGATNYFWFMKYVPFSACHKLDDLARTLERGLFAHERDAHKKVFNPDDCRDMIDFFLKETRENEEKVRAGEKVVTGFKEEYLPSLIGDIFAAGTDTTACSMYWLMILTIKYPKYQLRVQEELDRVVGRHRLPRQSDRSSLPFVNAFLAETLRFAAGGPFGVPHGAVTDTTFRGYDVPKGTVMVANHYAILYDPEVFPNPDTFDPCRFLDEDGYIIKSLVDRTHSQFGVGRRACVGEQLAQSERFIFFTHLLHQFNFSAPNGPDSVSLNSHFGLSRSPFPYELRAEKRDIAVIIGEGDQEPVRQR